jgi:HAD superfamily hydrolase (TIGR01509 family)
MTSPSIPDRISAVLFDIDGTLMDSNYAHVAAWMYAFHSAGCGVEAWRIHESIGMDSAKLLDRLVGDQSDAVRDQAKDEHSKRYAQMSDLLRAFDGARELLRAISARDVKVVLATSAPQDELERLRDLLDVEDAIETVTNAEDVETAKPAPDIVQVALEKSGSAASETIFVGDTVWDVRAAADAGVACVAVQSGGIHEQALRDAGAVAVFETIRELRADLEARGLA